MPNDAPGMLRPSQPAERARVSFSTGTFYHRSPRYSFDLAHDLGFDGVELVVGPNLVRDGGDATLADSQATGVPVLSVHPPFFPIPGWSRAPADAIPRLVAGAESLGAELCVVHTPAIAQASSPRFYEFAAAVRAGAKSDVVNLTIESSQVNRNARRHVLDDLAEMMKFAVDAGCGVTLDTSHVGANGQDLLTCYEIVRPALRNVHLSDIAWRGSRPRTHLQPGQGMLALRPFLAALARDQYRGLITLEIHPRETGLWSRGRAVNVLRSALAFVRSALDGAMPAHTNS